MSGYQAGLEVLGGDWSDGVADYDYGEKQVTQLLQFFSALGRPKEFEPAVEAVYASYEKAKAWEPLGARFADLRWAKATPMKQVGQDAARLMAEIQAAYPAKAAVVPSAGASAVYIPSTSGSGKPWIEVPGWIWALLATGVCGGVLYMFWPSISGALAARRGAARRAS